LQNGNIVWNQPWGSFGAARNYVSKRAYEGFNQFYLSYKAARRNYTTPFYLTYKQAQDLGGYIRKGEKATPVIFWKVSVRKTGRKISDQKGCGKRRGNYFFLPFYSSCI
jgi:antirestriction protein ArdC